MKSIFIKITFVIALGILITSCLRTQTYERKAEILERSFDNTLQDSAMICGYVLSAYNGSPWTIRQTILVAETKDSVQDNDIGYFSVKLLPGTYTFKCFDSFLPSSDDTLTLKISNVLPNEKIIVKFYKKVVIW